MSHTLNLDDFRDTTSVNIIASSSKEQKRLSEVARIDEHLRTSLYYQVSVRGEIVLSNATLEAAVNKYNAIK